MHRVHAPRVVHGLEVVELRINVSASRVDNVWKAEIDTASGAIKPTVDFKAALLTQKIQNHPRKP